MQDSSIARSSNQAACRMLPGNIGILFVMNKPAVGIPVVEREYKAEMAYERNHVGKTYVTSTLRLVHF